MDIDYNIITDDFISKYEKIQPNWGFNGLGYIVYKRTYSRPISGENRTEEWHETIQRCINGAQKIGANYTKEEAERLFDYVFNLKCNFAGRMLWQLGTSTVDRFGANSLLNCFEKNTEILTNQGVKKIGSLEGQVVTLMTEYGKWVEAPIKKFGKQQLYKICLKKGSLEKEILVTGNHDWFRHPRRHGEERDFSSKIKCKTIELKENDKLVSTFGQSPKAISEISTYGVHHGLVFGDGSICNNVGQLTLCGEKNEQLLELFPWHKTYELGNGHTCVVNLPKYFKSAPDLSMDKSYLYGFLAGYFAADGHITENGGVRISSSKKENLELVRDICSKIGISTCPIRVQNRIGIDQTEPSELFSISLGGYFLTESFFLIKEHKERFLNHVYDKPKDWKIVSVEKTDIIDEVYCAQVPETHSFVIEGNILTGNCWNVRINEINSFCFLFENLMLGGGVGYSVRKEDIHELPRVKKEVVIKVKNTKDADYIVPDSREGWVSLLRKVLESFFETGKCFNYSTILIRGAGEPINGFGGTASGPKILEDGIEKIYNVIKGREGKKLRSIDCLDICNIIGSIVVAGNVRRSAEIALGDPDDFLFIRAKRWDLGNIPNWRAMSNNTIYADDYDHIMEGVWDGYAGNGEPYGFFNLPLSQAKGRIKDVGTKNDANVCGTNPCVTGDTKILTSKGLKRIDKLVGKKIEIWNGHELSNTEVKITGKNQPILKIKTSNGNSLKCTYNHKFILKNEERVNAIDLKIGDSLYTGSHYKDYQPQNDVKIISISEYGVADLVYCFKDLKRGFGIFNNILTGQCGEISLENYECCNLSELYLNNIKSKEELLECSKLLYKTQKAICALPFIHEETNRVVHKNFRIGQGITGICQSSDKIEWLDYCYNELKKFDKEWSKQMNWPKSIKLTTVKPSGTLSILAGATPGVHPAFSKYYIRRVRMSSSDILIDICKELGYKVEFALNFDGTQNHDTCVVEFPCFAGNDVILAEEMSAIKQLDLVKKIQSEWSDNAVSCTVYYKKEELEDIKEWLRKNYKNNIKSVSFLLHSEHGFKQAPYEEIDERTYNKLKSKTKPIESIVGKKIQSGDSLEGIECEGGSCPIK